MSGAQLDAARAAGPSLTAAGGRVAVTLRKNSRARRYILRFQRPAGVVATIPRGGTRSEALAFVARNEEWILRQLAKPAPAPKTHTWFRGEKVPCEAFDREAAWQLARVELVERTRELAATTGSQVARISIRNQRSRWGSCSLRRTISLNWRLIQTPPFVVDYIILHELMHLRQMNHSERFWAEVEAVCPGWREAERWLKQNSRDILR